MTPEQLLDLAAPLVAKINQRIPLEASEAEQHAAILDEAFKKLNVQRSRDVAERDARLAERYQHRPAQTITSEEASGLNTFYSGIDN